ncbi:hypothetical protein PpBr36_08668 [Pyricularia pennisetigena]|uniref:hypothetical protein n=1 Tax=Pyricularia pennisetigena TaxID=1578925 RepID=UPI001152AB37|nr:hypothetical protein PpBr36_08668 [Pyricularia pennisetigena]TLS24207.1 hypothetical protein PpBr36_08668 [Pyricularia pennisetigena]
MGEVAPPPKAVTAGTDPELGITYAPESSGSIPSKTAANPPRRWKKWQIYAVNGLALAACLSAAIALAISEKINSDVSIPEQIYVESVCGPQRALTPGAPDDCLQMSLDGPMVDLNYTTYVGTTRKSGINVFLGMRYAEPPLGQLRWRAPIEPSGDRDGPVARAKAFGPICLATDAAFPNDQQSEDCLFVNVWAPDNATENSKLPVWLFIQGGGYTSNSNANWDGEEVVKRSNNSIVFVNFNYRVGLFGFLASDQVKKDGELNVGLLDQRLMMKWIRKHISKFGGDPDHVVISGLSAGAGSVALQLAAYGGRDDKLFTGAIVESMFFPAQPYLSELEWQFDRLVKGVGCDGVLDQKMACLREKSTMALQAANKASPFPGRTQPPLPLFYWTPCIDGDLIRKLPYDMFGEGKTIDVPLMIGATTNEGSVFAANAETKDEMFQFLNNNYPGLRERDLDDIGDRYPLMSSLPQHRPWFPSTSKAYGEATFICPTVNVLDDVSSNFPNSRNKTWAYRYNVQDQDALSLGLGVQHTAEVGAVFGPDSVLGQAPASYKTYNAPIVPVVMDYWISFVKTLSPNALKNADAPIWAPYASRSGANSSDATNGTLGGNSHARLILETNNTRMEQVPSDELSRCQFWKSLKDRTQQKL